MTLPVGARIGIIGGGQLGRMLAGAAARLGFDTSVYCPERDCPAARVAADNVVADYNDLPALLSWAQTCDVVTYEFENVPVGAVNHLTASGCLVRPGARSLEVAQDRLQEKTFLSDCGVQTAGFRPVNNLTELASALEALGGSGILKTRREGYDGKGQRRVSAGDDLERAFADLNAQPCVLEEIIPFTCEVSTLVARSITGETLCYDVPRNEHVDGVLHRSIVPSGVDAGIEEAAREAAVRVADALGHVGVLALEFFVLEDGQLLANELAPRVHNSGHWTPEACITGQFEQHILAVSGWPLGPVARLFDAEMGNLLGADALTPFEASPRGSTVTLYGKQEAKAGRKMGHWVRTGF
jgi:5-(carboxyamino)imidazole ribonucleotide synthase